jgi:hypothetical protein
MARSTRSKSGPGLSHSSAHAVVDPVRRPLEIVLVLLAPLVVASFGASAVR